MAVVGSGTISFSNLQTEFGGSHPISFSEYYRNGAYTTSNNTNVPTSGTIKLSNFYGATGFVADYTPNAIDWTSISASDPFSGYASGWTNTITVGGINSTTTFKVVGTSINASASGDSGSGIYSFFVRCYKNTNTNVGSISKNIYGGNSTQEFSFTVVNGDTLFFEAELTVSDQLGEGASGSGGCTMTITNTSTGGTAIDTFSVVLNAATPGGA